MRLASKSEPKRPAFSSFSSQIHNDEDIKITRQICKHLVVVNCKRSNHESVAIIMAIFLACRLSLSAAVEHKVSQSASDQICGLRRRRQKGTHRSPRRPDEGHPTFPILFHTDDLSLRTLVSLHVFDDLSVRTTFSVLDHLVAALLRLS